MYTYVQSLTQLHHAERKLCVAHPLYHSRMQFGMHISTFAASSHSDCGAASSVVELACTLLGSGYGTCALYKARLP